jgi:hypothetical protein
MAAVARSPAIPTNHLPPLPVATSMTLPVPVSRAALWARPALSAILYLGTIGKWQTRGSFADADLARASARTVADRLPRGASPICRSWVTQIAG